MARNDKLFAILATLQKLAGPFATFLQLGLETLERAWEFRFQQKMRALADGLGGAIAVKPLYAARPEGDDAVLQADQCLGRIKGLQPGFEIRRRRHAILAYGKHLT
jgi:hypothetical protein